MKSQRARQIVELRRSGASGIHGKFRKDRANINRKAIMQNRRDNADSQAQSRQPSRQGHAAGVIH